MPQRASLLNGAAANNSSPFNSSVLGPNWHSTRDRASTHSGTQSKEQDQDFIKDLADTDVKTLDYLGLVDRPSNNRPRDEFNMEAYIANLQRQQQFANFNPNPYDNNASRYRSYSVNAKERYAGEEEMAMDPGLYSGTMTPSDVIAANLAATQAQIHQHNLDVQAYASQASSSRPRARTAGALDSPVTWRNYPQRAPELAFNRILADSDYQGLADSVQAMQLQGGSLKNKRGDQDFAGEDATRALWLGNIPSSTTTSSLKVIFEPFGKIESARVLTHKSCGFVNFEARECAVHARQQLNGKEIFPGAGPVRIGYAKALSSSGTPSGNDAYTSPSPDPFGHKQADAGASSVPAPSRSRGVSSVTSRLEVSVPTLPEARSEIFSITKDFGASETDQLVVGGLVDRAISFDGYEPEIPPVQEPSASRVHDAPRLRDVRKRIDNGSCSPMEIENVAMQMLPEIAELSSDYLGNTVVQKLFENCSESTKEAMLREIAPHLSEIGVHKNGTWAAQKIIDVARTDYQQQMIVEALHPHGVALFLDQYGNYVMQCCLKFTRNNSFIFELMLARLWDIAQGRFGARAMRACLESHHATKEQQRTLAAAIALHSVQLATNANGALLLTWFLDTCNFPHRRKALAPRLIPHLVQLCTHKVAYLTVLKIINQRNEPEARDMILHSLFFSADDNVLADILRDTACGATLIFKILTTPFLEESIRPEVQERIRIVLARIKAVPHQGYKRLMDEVGLSTRGAPGARDAKDLPPSKSNGSMAGLPPQVAMNGGFLNPSIAGPSLGMPPATGFEAYNGGDLGALSASGYGQSASLTSPATPLSAQQAMQYQQNLYGAARAPSYGMHQGGIMNDTTAAGQQSPIDLYRNNMARAQQQSMQMSANPGMISPSSYVGQAGYNPMMGMSASRAPGMWQPPPPQPPPYGGNMYASPSGQSMQSSNMMGNGSSRGRVS